MLIFAYSDGGRGDNHTSDFSDEVCPGRRGAMKFVGKGVGQFII